MPQVPYSPYPTVAPTTQGTPEVRINAPAEAFGEGIARAVEHLGTVSEHVGTELFQRAVAMQQLANESDAKEADAKYMIAAGDLHAKFGALEGKQRVDAYRGYVDDLQKLRLNLRGGLGNDSARKMYDSSSLMTMGRTIFNGAGAAASAQREYSIAAAKGQQDLDAKTVSDDPTDDRLFQNKRDRTIENVKQVSALSGNPEGGPAEQSAILNATSKLTLQRLVGMSRKQPFEAGVKLNEWSKELTEDDRLRADNIITAQKRSVGSANIADKVYNAGAATEVKPGKSLKDMEEEAKAEAKSQDPDDPILAQHAVAALRGKWNQDKYAAKQTEAENNEIINNAIQQGTLTEQQLRTDPKVAAAIDSLPKDKQLAIPARINSYNAAKNKVANEDAFNQLQGLSNNDVEAFLDLDPYKQNLNQSQMQRIVARQKELKKNQNQDPQVQRAVGWMRGARGAELEALGVYSRTQANKDDYDHYTGTLQLALDVWSADHKRRPTQKEVVEEIGPQVIRQRAEPGWLWGTNQKPFFKQTVPDDFSEKLKADIVAKGLTEPTEEEIYKAYIRTQYNNLYGGAKPSTKDQSRPAVPMSR